MDFQSLIIRVPAILAALTFHEFFHGMAALKRGDRTADLSGRLTLNPLDHLDPLGTLMLMFGPFGWAKPVPVNPQNLKDPKKDIIWVSLAGPAANIMLAVSAGWIYRYLIMAFIPESELDPVFVQFMELFLLINLGIAFFNLIPIPPLDGSKILAGFLPDRKVAGYYRAVKHAPIVFLILITAQWMFNIPVFSAILSPFWVPWMKLWYYVIFG
ncbi:MAG: site-2 protease family protein [Chitinivibrionales bacterium]